MAPNRPLLKLYIHILQGFDKALYRGGEKVALNRPLVEVYIHLVQGWTGLQSTRGGGVGS